MSDNEKFYTKDQFKTFCFCTCSYSCFLDFSDQFYWDNLNRKRILPFFMFFVFYKVKVLKRHRKLNIKRCFMTRNPDLHTSK